MATQQAYPAASEPVTVQTWAIGEPHDAAGQIAGAPGAVLRVEDHGAQGLLAVVLYGDGILGRILAPRGQHGDNTVCPVQCGDRYWLRTFFEGPAFVGPVRDIEAEIRSRYGLHGCRRVDADHPWWDGRQWRTDA